MQSVLKKTTENNKKCKWITKIICSNELSMLRMPIGRLKDCSDMFEENKEKSVSIKKTLFN